MGMDGCCGPGGSCGTRSFLTKEEKTERLKEYKDSLQKEIQAVSERIEELKLTSTAVDGAQSHKRLGKGK